MKKIIYLFSIIFLLVGLVGCGDDDNNSSSSPTGLDFTSDDVFEELNSYFVISGTDSEFRILIATKNAVTSSELIINGSEVDINSAWIDFTVFSEDFAYGLFIDDASLPQSLSITPGMELDIEFTLNGTSFDQVVTVPAAPVVENKDLDLDKDFTVEWTLSENSQTQVVELMGEGYFWDDDDEGLWLDAEVSGSTRSHKFSKSGYSDYVLTGLSWYEYGVQAINYKLSNNHIVVLTSDDYNEEYIYGNMNTKDRVIKTNKLVNSLTK